MQEPHNAAATTSRRRSTRTSITLIAALGVLLVPIIPMVHHTSSQPLVLGRYAPTYFALMVAYLLAAITFSVVVAWLLRRLASGGLKDMQEQVARRPAPFVIGLLLAVAGLTVYVQAVELHVLTFPERFTVVMEWGPCLWFGLIMLAAAFAFDVETRVSAARQLEARIERLAAASKLHGDGVMVALVVFAVTLVAITIFTGLWQYPLGGDPSAHIYLGERIVSGDLPYRAFINFQPPLRLPASALWAETARLSGLPIVAVGRLYCLAIAVALLVLAYAIGERLTERRLGGVLAAAALLGMEPLSQIVVRGPNTKLVIILFLALSIVAVQRERWFLGGLFGGISTLMWLPSGLNLIAIGLAALLQNEQHRLRTLLLVALGAALVLVLTLGTLGGLGLLGDAYRQTVVATVQYLRDKALSDAGGGGGYVKGLTVAFRFLRQAFQEDGALVLLALAGLIVLPLARGLRQVLSEPRYAAPLLTALLLMGALSFDFQGLPDLMTVLPLVMPFAAVPLAEAARLTTNVPDTIRLRASAEWVLIALVLIYGMADVSNGYSDPQPLSLAMQQRMADQLDAVLPPDATVQVIDDLWFLDLTWRPNATRYNWLGSKVQQAIAAEGLTMDDVSRAIQDQRPVIVMISGDVPDAFQGWLTPGYVSMGSLKLGPSGPMQQMFVRADQPALQEIIGTWMLEK